MTDIVLRAKQALWDRYRKLSANISVDAKGYIENPEKNLLQPEWMEFIRADYKKGGGKELEQKFWAVHSSAALVSNHFARFKKEPHYLTIASQGGFNMPIFEKQLPTGLRGIPPNLDVFLENSNVCIAIESKLLETLAKETTLFPKLF